MKQQPKIICDKCGTEWAPPTDCVLRPPEWRQFSKDGMWLFEWEWTGETYELCPECAQILKQYMNKQERKTRAKWFRKII